MEKTLRLLPTVMSEGKEASIGVLLAEFLLEQLFQCFWDFVMVCN